MFWTPLRLFTLEHRTSIRRALITLQVDQVSRGERKELSPIQRNRLEIKEQVIREVKKSDKSLSIDWRDIVKLLTQILFLLAITL